MTIEVKFPLTPGKYILSFRLVHGENKTEFGDEITVNLVAQAPAGRAGKRCNCAVGVAECSCELSCCEGESEQACENTACCPRKCCNKGLPCCQQLSNETDGNTFYVDRDQDDKSVGDLDLSINSWLMVQDGEDEATT